MNIHGEWPEPGVPEPGTRWARIGEGSNMPGVGSDMPRDPRKTTRKALVRVARKVMEELLHLPSGKILSVRDSDREGEFDVLVESPDFEPVQIGSRLPNLTIMYDTKHGRIIKSRWGG